MPHYEYYCTRCHLEFEEILTIHESEDKKITCPKCGGDKVEQKVSAFFAMTGKKS